MRAQMKPAAYPICGLKALQLTQKTFPWTDMAISVRILLVTPGFLCSFRFDLVFCPSLRKTISHPLFLFPPMAALFIVCTDAQRLPQSLTLFNLGFS
jgi:hypothetical protein